MKRLLKEGLSARLWRISSVQSAWTLFKRNELVAKLAAPDIRDFQLNKGKIYFVSFARSITSSYLKIFNRRDVSVVIEFDGRALGNRYKGAAVSYYSSSDEMEDRIFTNKPSIRGILKWVTSVSIIGLISVTENRRMVRDITNACLKRGIEIKFYENMKNFRNRREWKGQVDFYKGVPGDNPCKFDDPGCTMYDVPSNLVQFFAKEMGIVKGMILIWRGEKLDKGDIQALKEIPKLSLRVRNALIDLTTDHSTLRRNLRAGPWWRKAQPLYGRYNELIQMGFSWDKAINLLTVETVDMIKEL